MACVFVIASLVTTLCHGLTTVSLHKSHELDATLAVPTVEPSNKRRHPLASGLLAGEWTDWVVRPVFRLRHKDLAHGGISVVGGSGTICSQSCGDKEVRESAALAKTSLAVGKACKVSTRKEAEVNCNCGKPQHVVIDKKATMSSMT